MPRRFALAIAATLTAAVAVVFIAAGPSGFGAHSSDPATETSFQQIIEYVQATPAGETASVQPAADVQPASLPIAAPVVVTSDDGLDDEGAEYEDDHESDGHDDAYEHEEEGGYEDD